MEDKMKKLALVLLVTCLALPLAASYHKSWTMLTASVDCAADTVLTRGTDFTSRPIPIGKESYPRDCSVTITFTRAAGSASTVDFEFEVSTDNGATWSLLREADTLDTPLIQIPTNTPVITGTTVRVTFYMNIPAVSHIRLRSIDNNDVANALTAINVTLSL